MKPKSTRGKIAQATALLMSLQFLSQATAVGKQVVIAALFGTSAMTDSYLVAMTVVGLLQVWISLPIRQVLIPMFRRDLATDGEDVAWHNIHTLFNNFVVLLVVVSVLGGLAAPWLVDLTAPGFSEETSALTTSLTRITMPSVALMVLGITLSQIFYCYERFLVPGLASTVDNVVMIVAVVVLGHHYGIYGIAIAVVLGDLAQVVLQLPILWKHRRYTWKTDLRHPRMGEMGKLSFPLLVSTGGQELSRITDRVFASLLTPGSLSALAYGGRLIGLVHDFLIDALQQSTFPHFSRLTAEEKYETLSRQLFHYLRVVFFLTIPMAVGIALLADAIVKVFFQRGAFDATSTLITSQALACFAIGFPASAAARILNRTFFSLRDTWTPSNLALGRIGVKIVLSWVLLRPFSYLGLAMAESLSHIARIVPLILLLPPALRGREGYATAKSLARSLAAAAFMGAGIWAARTQLAGSLPTLVELAVMVPFGVLLYGLASLLLGGDELPSLWSTLQGFRRVPAAESGTPR